MSSIEPKITPLHSWHLSNGANMADFGGFDMPLWYPTGVKNEHLSVLRSAGIFDTSHMASILVQGKDAGALINYCLSRDISHLTPGRSAYGAFLNAKGHCIDDAIVYPLSDSSIMVCVNAGMGETITDHLKQNTGSWIADATDVSGTLAKLDIQGPNSLKILYDLVKDPENVFDLMHYFSFKGSFDQTTAPFSRLQTDLPGVCLKDGTPVLISRSGYTGELGFEIFINGKNALRAWEDLVAAGQPYGITACGLGARDSLRAGACLPLSHQDIGDWPFINHPWMFALPFSKDKKSFTKSFIGDSALLNSIDSYYTYPFAGDSLRKIGTGEKTRVIDDKGHHIGIVLTCATDMALTWHDSRIVSVNTPDLPENTKFKGISCGFVRVNCKLSNGTQLKLEEGKRQIDVTIVKDIRPDRTARKKLDLFI